ncbi:MAG: hypothetical protein ABFC81_02510, partial [Rectinema sp.]
MPQVLVVFSKVFRLLKKPHKIRINLGDARGILPEAIQAAGVIPCGFTFFDHFYMMPVRPMDYEQFGIDAGLAEALGAFDPVRAAI